LSDDDDVDELPDFENDDDYEDDSSSSTVAASNIIPRRTSTSTNIIVSKDTITRRGSSGRSGVGLDPKLAEEIGGNVDGLDSEIILDAMRGKSSSSTTSSEGWQPPRSLRDTINDRSLEKYMNFDKMIERDNSGSTTSNNNNNNKASVKVELPDFDEVINRRKQREAMQEGGRRSVEVDPAAAKLLPIDTSRMGKKAARDAERRALAMQRTKDEESSSSGEQRNEWITSLFTDLNIVKVTENGAWIGIGLLVVWEIYINSPFFDRAAPLIPVVYDTLPPGMGK
jgi:hypothetical protein